MKEKKSIRDIKGLNKKELTKLFLAEAKAAGITYYDKATFNSVMRAIWMSTSTNSSWRLTKTGYKFLTDLGIEAHKIPFESLLITGDLILKMGRAISWPFYVELDSSRSGTVYVFSSEFGMWAILQGNDLESIINLYLSA